jgi:proline iminopeptidase
MDDVRDLEAVRAHFRANRVSVIGYSYMGLLVMLYALEHPDHVERVVQMSPVPMRFDVRYPPGLVEDYAAAVDAAGVKRLDSLQKAGFDRSHPKEYCEADWEVNRFALATIASIKPISLDASAVRGATMPVLTVHGTRDRNAPYGGGREWAVSLPNARLLTVRGAAHESFDEFPDVVLPAIATFLKGAWPARAEKITTLVP